MRWLVVTFIVGSASALGCEARVVPAEHVSSVEPAPPAEGAWPKIGQWHRAPPRPADAIDADEAARLLSLGYVGGDRPAPAQRSVTHYDAARATPGVNLYVSGHASEAHLIDMRGAVLHTWSFPREQAFPGLSTFAADKDRDRLYWRRARLLPGGDLLAIYEGAGLIRLDARGKLVWAHQGWNHHAVSLDAAGRLVTLGRHRRVVPALRPTPIIDDTVQVLTQDGRQLQEVSLLDALMQGDDQSWRARLVDDEDALHTNAVVPLDASHAPLGPAFTPGRVLVSIRELDALAVLDLAHGVVVATFRGGWKRQHDPVPLPGGRLLLFDNQGLGERSRALELDFARGRTLWSYSGGAAQPFYSKCCGLVQRLSTGNTLITETETGRAVEVTPAGEVVWELWNPHRTGPGEMFIAALFEVVRLPEQPWLATLERGGTARD